jgi:hypothetical protein
MWYLVGLMRNLLFVHGTGVRGESYFRSLDLVCRKAEKYLPAWSVKGCDWGGPFGARLNRGGDSIPGYSESGDPIPALEDADRARWHLLAQDPLLELRIIQEESVIGEIPGEWIWRQIPMLAQNTEVNNIIEPWGISKAWTPCINALRTSREWQQIVCSITQPAPAASDKVARAIVALFQLYLREEGYPGLTGSQRDELKNLILQYVGGPPLGLTDWFLERLTNFGMPRRGKLSDFSSPAVGDILRYQSRGQEIRNFIEEQATNSTCAILAHSLGGIASVDWVASKETPIEYLVTAGSQAPYFYEIDALVSRSFGSGLPKFFPKWLNFLDPRDFLSYRAAKIFPGFAQDKWVDNGQPFPESHGAYWNNDEVWEEIKQFLPKY